MELNIGKDYSKTPGGRKKDSGDYSGEDFLEKCLKKQFEEALRKGEPLFVNFDGLYGYPSSFLEESFGGIVRLYKESLSLNEIFKTIILVSNDNPLLIERVSNYMYEASKK